jgi:hypothetical protein
MRLTEGSAATWPAEDQAGVDRALTETWLPRLRSGSGTSAAWTELGWMRAPDAFVERQCATWGPEIVRAMESTGGAANLRVPVVTHGRLVVGLHPHHGDVLPPTLAGWRRFLDLGPASGETFTVLEGVGRWWFGRSVPRDLLSAAREDPLVSSDASSAPRSKANATATSAIEASTSAPKASRPGAAAETSASFRDKVLRAAQATPGRYGDHLVLISRVWREARRQGLMMTLPEFKENLLAAYIRRELVLAKADMPQTLDRVELDDSRVVDRDRELVFIELVGTEYL